MPDTASASGPWRMEQQVQLIVGLGFSGLVLLAGYIGTSGEARPTDQYPWISLAILGVACSGVVHARWLVAGLVAVRSLQRDVLATLAASQDAESVGHSAALTSAPAAGAQWVTVQGASTYVHQPGCVMVAGKRTLPAPTAGERRPCRLCSD